MPNLEILTFEELIATARAIASTATEEWDPDADAIAWRCIEVLASRTDAENLAAVIGLAGGNAFDRSVAATVLGRMQLPPEMDFPELTSVLLEMLAREQDQEVIDDLLSGLGQWENDPRILAAALAWCTHPYWSIRWTATLRLLSYETSEAALALMGLMNAPDESVREWATFGLKNMTSMDSPIICDAFAARLEDDFQIRSEAIVGLALRQDERAVAAVLREINTEGASPLFDALVDSPDYELIPALREMVKGRNKDANLRLALQRCEAYSLK